MTGWIKIDRSIVNHWLWSDAEYLKWWLDLLVMAAYEERKVLHDSHIITLRKGEMIASVGQLQTRWKKNHQTILRFLKLLQDEKMITRRVVYRQTSILSICNYESYQIYDDNRAYSITDSIVYNNIKNIKNNNISSSLRSEDSSDKSDPEGEKFDFKFFLDFFNSELESCGAIIPRLKVISQDRKNHILARLREYGAEQLTEMVKKAARSDFLNGNNSKGWIADFSWLIRPTNFVKVIEGNYDNKLNLNQQNGIFRQDGKNRRTGDEVQATSAEDYKTTF